MNADYWIQKLHLQPHPEGGYYKETYRSKDLHGFQGFEGERNVSTAIYLLLQEKEKSHLHRIRSDELWFFHEGAPLEILIMSAGKLQTCLLGKNAAQGEAFQVTVPAGSWFGARLKKQSGFALVSCTVAPGFDFRDFEMGIREDLIHLFPEQANMIRQMTP